MEVIIEVVLQLLAEIFIQVLFELGFHSLIEPFRKKPSAVVSLVGYSTLGVFAGGVSCVFFQELFVEGESLQLLNILVTPVIAGLVMAYLGKLREKKGVELIRLDKFAFGFAFAFAMALSRYFIISLI